MNKLILALCLLFGSVATAEIVQPQNIEDLYKTSVRIYDKKEASGGTGSIFKSHDGKASHILTNKHVCRIIEQGGLVNYNDKNYKITHYKKFAMHDLCLVRVATDFGVSLEIANVLSKKSSTVYVSGHPSLLPHIATKGHLSDNMDIQLVVGIKACKEDERSLECAWFGGKPVVKTFASQVVSNLIKPGSSGSAVFNEDGNLVGVVYAGSGRDFSHGFIVPHIYVIMFLQNSHRYDWIRVGTKVPKEGFIKRLFNYNRCREAMIKDTKKYAKIKKFCRSVQDNMIWSK